MKTLLLTLVLVGCSSPPSPKAVELDLCAARRAYKLVAMAANGALDPVPGSPRDKLETAEDALCALVAP